VAKHQYSSLNKAKLPEMKATFPKFKAINAKLYFKNFDEVSLDLLSKMIVLDPARRISMKEALRHPYFNDLS
jgi:cyclin-dependent kinase 2